MRKSRQDSIYSQKYIMEAVTQMLHDHNFEDITVTDICKRAGVARVTFYKYYHTIHDVMNASVQANVEHFLEKIADLNPHEDLQLMIEYAVEGVVPARTVLKKLIDSNMSGVLLDYFNYAVEAISQSDPALSNHISRAQVLFLAGGIFNIITDWIKEGSKESPKSVAAKIYEILPVKTKDSVAERLNNK